MVLLPKIRPVSTNFPDHNKLLSPNNFCFENELGSLAIPRGGHLSKMASGRGRTHVLLTGFPGVGKTTLCRKVFEVLNGKGIKVQGFYTEEVRNSQKGSRVGFDVVTLDGQRGPLARTKG